MTRMCFSLSGGRSIYLVKCRHNGSLATHSSLTSTTLMFHRMRLKLCFGLPCKNILFSLQTSYTNDQNLWRKCPAEHNVGTRKFEKWCFSKCGKVLFQKSCWYWTQCKLVYYFNFLNTIYKNIRRCCITHLETWYGARRVNCVRVGVAVVRFQMFLVSVHSNSTTWENTIWVWHQTISLNPKHFRSRIQSDLKRLTEQSDVNWC